MTSQLPPREIQARIRSGETVDDVALAAQTTAEKVMIYAGPVLAERAHIAGLAQAASVRSGSGGAGVLEELVAGRLRSVSTSPGEVDWDAWKQPDGRWAVSAEFALDSVAQRALFTYDVAGRYSVAEDDLARWLVGEIDVRPGSRRTPTVDDTATDAGAASALDGTEIPLPPAPAEQTLRAVRDGALGAEPEAPDQTGDPVVVSGVDAPAEVRSSSPDDQLTLGDDAIALVTGSTSPRPAAVSSAAWELQPAEPSWLTSRQDNPAADADSASEPTPEPTPEPDPELASAPETRPEGASSPSAGAPAGAGAQEVLFGEPAASDAEDDRSKPSRKRGRASIPSWDEIMFGGPSDGAPLADGEGSSSAPEDLGPSQA